MRKSDVTVAMPYYGTHESRWRAWHWVTDRWDACFGFRITIGEEEPHTRSEARNLAAQEADSKYLILADADTAFDPEAIELGYEMMENGANWVVLYARLKYYALNEKYTKQLLQRDPKDAIANDLEYEFKMTSWSGLQMVRTDDYWKIGGHDERFIGWGWEDLAFQVKMDAEIGPHSRTDGRAMHLWHARGDAKFGTAEEQMNKALFETDYKLVYNWKDERVR